MTYKNRHKCGIHQFGIRFQNQEMVYNKYISENHRNKTLFIMIILTD